MKTHVSNALRGFICGFAASALGALLIALTLLLGLCSGALVPGMQALADSLF